MAAGKIASSLRGYTMPAAAKPQAAAYSRGQRSLLPARQPPPYIQTTIGTDAADGEPGEYRSSFTARVARRAHSRSAIFFDTALTPA